MYKIYADNTLIYDSTLEDYTITKGQITKELNKSGSFSFTIYSDHVFYNYIQKMKTIIRVFKNSELIFRGRVINEEIGFYKDKTYLCEGELGFLLDSIIRPYEFSGTPEELLSKFIADHNSQVDETKQFILGTVTVTDPNDYIVRSNENYESTSDNLQKKLLDPLGGYIFITTNSAGKRVINWYADSPYRSNQRIEFGENLLEFIKANHAEDIATAIIPLGADVENEETGEKNKLTISEVNDGVDYVYSQSGVDLYGWIFKTETWDNVTLASNLKTKAEAFLANKIKQTITIELSAIDLSLMDKTIDSFQLGDYIKIVSDPHNLNDDYLLEKQTIDLLKPDNDKITLGYTYSSFTDRTATSNNNNQSIVKTVEKIQADYVTNEVVYGEAESLRSLINQTATSFKTEIMADYVVNDELIASQSTLYTQLNDSFEYMFNTLESSVNANDAEARREFSEIKKYIRFENGNIVLGESGNELTLKIENDRIAFYEGSSEVAYISNKKLYITDAEVLTSIHIGKFAFIPRANGNLSFKKVGG